MVICDFSPFRRSSICYLMSPEEIRSVIEVVAAPPRQWPFTLGERVAVVNYLGKRKHDILDAHA
jgi:hypothetical protein